MEFKPRPKPDKNTSKKKYKIPPVSKTMTEGLKKYNQMKETKKADMIAGRFYRCFFSNKILDENIEWPWHHALGRKGNLLWEYKNIFPCIHEYHTDYHDLSIDKLMKLDWYKEFLERVSRINHGVYNHELKRMNKGNIIDDEQYFKMYK